MSTPTPADWPPCPPGEIERLAARLALRAKLRLAATAGAAALAAVVVIAGGWYGVTAILDASEAHDSQSGCCGCAEPAPSPAGSETQAPGAK